MTVGPTPSFSRALPGPDWRYLRVDAVVREAEGVVSLRLADPDGGPLPPWEAGAHLDLCLPSGLVRQYSLCGDPTDSGSYTVAVLRDDRGRGGSREIHSSGLVGGYLGVRGPKNHFALAPAPAYLFLAGGIGITPISAMAMAASAAGVPWTLVYGGRTRASMAFLEELSALPGDLRLYPQDERGLPDLAAEVAAASQGTAVYCCGPESMLRAAGEACARCAPPLELHVERFSAAPRSAVPPTAPTASTAPVDGQVASPGSFEVELGRTGGVLTVYPDRSILATVRDVRPEVPSSCEEGICGTCETRVLSGTPEHRDEILSPAEREAGDRMMICVSRSASPRLVLDL